MKKIAVFILLALSLAFTSCEKQVIEPNIPPETVTVNVEVDLYGEWVLRDGKMYMENLETGETIVYDHFDATQTVSSLRYSGAILEFETIERNITSWSFFSPPNVTGTGEFILDNDFAEPYGLSITYNNVTIIEHPTVTTPAGMQLGGSARPISAVLIAPASDMAEFIVQEAYESISGENWRYYSILTLEKVQSW